MGIHEPRVASLSRYTYRHVGAKHRIDKLAVISLTILSVPYYIREDLGNSEAHLFKGTETEALSIGRRKSHISNTIELADFLIRQGHLPTADQKSIGQGFGIHTSQNQLSPINLKEGKAPLISLVTDTHQEDQFGGMADNEIHKGHNHKVMALSGLIAINIEKEEDFLGDSHGFPNCGSLQISRKEVPIKSMRQNINGSRDSLSLQDLTPLLRKDKEAIRISLKAV
jgi:hypothetical protein